MNILEAGSKVGSSGANQALNGSSYYSTGVTVTWPEMSELARRGKKNRKLEKCLLLVKKNMKYEEIEMDIS